MPHNPAQKAESPAHAATFLAELQEERNALATVIDTLQAEQDALVSGDTERVAALAAEKADRIGLLAALGAQRKRHLAAQALTDNAAGMLAWLSRNNGLAASVRTTWQDLLALADTAQQLNLGNGQLIDSQLQQNRAKLAVLQGAANSDGVYRRDGQLRSLRNARSFSAA